MTWEHAVPPKLPPNVRMVRNRLGREYLYFQRYRGTGKAEKPTRLPDDPRSPEFWVEYAKLLDLPPVPESNHSISALAEAWKKSPEWTQLSDKTKEEWERYLDRIEAAWGTLEVRGILPKNVLTLRDGYAATPASANNMLRCLSSMLGWSVPRGWRDDNPCREVKKLHGGDGYAPWPWTAITNAEEELRADLWWVCGVALYTGQRQADCLAGRWDHIMGNAISVKQEKTNKLLLIPLHRDLRAILDQIPKRSVNILTSSEGRPWTTDGFKATWNKHKPSLVTELGLVFHGLRKSAVVTLLEVGCTDAEVAAITGQSRKMIEHYAKMVNQERLARAAILKWENKNETGLVNTVGNTDGRK
jgi:hypothetical protein